MLAPPDISRHQLLLGPNMTPEESPGLKKLGVRPWGMREEDLDFSWRCLEEREETRADSILAQGTYRIFNERWRRGTRRGISVSNATPVLGAQIPESILPNVLCFGKNDLPAGACLADWSLDTRANWNPLVHKTTYPFTHNLNTAETCGKLPFLRLYYSVIPRMLIPIAALSLEQKQTNWHHNRFPISHNRYLDGIRSSGCAQEETCLAKAKAKREGKGTEMAMHPFGLWEKTERALGHISRPERRLRSAPRRLKFLRPKLKTWR